MFPFETGLGILRRSHVVGEERLSERTTTYFGNLLYQLGKIAK